MTTPSAPSWPQRPARPKRRSVPGEPDIEQKRKFEGGAPERRVTGRDEDNGEYPTGEPFRPDKTSSAKDTPVPPGTPMTEPKSGPYEDRLSVRTNNPGAMVAALARQVNANGLIGTHPNNNTAIFADAKYGFAAQTKALDDYYYKRGRKTLREIIRPWSGNNHSDAYSAFLAKRVNHGLQPDDEIPEELWRDPEFRYNFQKAQAEWEAGAVGNFDKAFNEQDLIDGLEMGGISFKKKADAKVGAEVKPQSQGLRLT